MSWNGAQRHGAPVAPSLSSRYSAPPLYPHSGKKGKLVSEGVVRDNQWVGDAEEQDAMVSGG